MVIMRRTLLPILIISILFCMVLCACHSRGGDTPMTEPSTTQTESISTEAQTTEPPETEPVTTEAEVVTEPLVEDYITRLPYVVKVTRADLQIFKGAGYDYGYVNLLRPGIYTIVEEKRDGEDNLWGKLKSGMGWIDITKATTVNKTPVPISVGLAERAMIDSGSCHLYTAADTTGLVNLIFYANEALTNVRLSSLDYVEESYMVSDELYTLPTLATGKPLVAQLPFPGDLTTYGISFTDARGAVRNFAVSVSGRNGAIVINEY